MTPQEIEKLFVLTVADIGRNAWEQIRNDMATLEVAIKAWNRVKNEASRSTILKMLGRISDVAQKANWEIAFNPREGQPPKGTTKENTMGLQETEKECAATATAPRVSLASMEAKISLRHNFVMGDAMKSRDVPSDPSLELLSVCVLVMQNGFTLIGKSAPASPENFNAELGAKLAYEDAIRQLWPLEGYALREKLSSE